MTSSDARQSFGLGPMAVLLELGIVFLETAENGGQAAQGFAYNRRAWQVVARLAGSMPDFRGKADILAAASLVEAETTLDQSRLVKMNRFHSRILGAQAQGSLRGLIEAWNAARDGDRHAHFPTWLLERMEGAAPTAAAPASGPRRLAA